MSEFSERLRRLAQDADMEAQVRRAIEGRRGRSAADASTASGAGAMAGDAHAPSSGPDVSTGEPQVIQFRRHTPTLGACVSRARSARGGTIFSGSRLDVPLDVAAGLARAEYPHGPLGQPKPAILKPNWWPEGEAKAGTIEELVPGVETRVERFGNAFMVETSVTAMGEGAKAIADRFGSTMADADAGVHERLRQSPGTSRNPLRAPVRPERLVFFDLETTGLASCPLFLIGAMVWEPSPRAGVSEMTEDEGDRDVAGGAGGAGSAASCCATGGVAGDLVVRQFFARHYGEEAAVVALFAALAGDKDVLVSFNGKSFDLPFVRARAAAGGVPIGGLSRPLPHLDLLHEARRLWRGQVPDCRLQTLERVLCSRQREGDIPGREIPDAYHNYVRNADASLMARVLHHNLLDLVTLAELVAMLPGA